MGKRRHGTPRTLIVRVIQRGDGCAALEVGGVVQSIGAPADASEAAPGYWAAMLPEACPRRALLLGVGGGTVARLLRDRCPATEIVGIERDERVLASARAELGLDAIAGLRVVVEDAFVWVPVAAEQEPSSYDYVCLDLFEAGRLTLGTLATGFLRQVATLLAPGGTLAVNLMVTRRTSEQLHRLARVFELASTVPVRGNIVVHLRIAQPIGTADLSFTDAVGKMVPESARRHAPAEGRNDR
jgi:spermidine synthase